MAERLDRRSDFEGSPLYEGSPLDLDDNYDSYENTARDTEDIRTSSLVFDELIDRFFLKLSLFLHLVMRATGLVWRFLFRAAFKSVSTAGSLLFILWILTAAAVTNLWKRAKRTRLVTAVLGQLQKAAARLSKSEQKLSGLAACSVEAIDARLEKAADCACCRADSSVRSFLHRWNALRQWFWDHKKRVLLYFTAGTVAAAGAAMLMGSITAYEYMYNGKTLGIVKNQEDVYKTVDLIGDKLSYEYGAEIKIDKEENISFRRIFGFNLPIDGKDQVLNAFTYLSDMDAAAYAITVEGKHLAIVDSRKQGENILSAIKNSFLSTSSQVEYKSIGFAEEVSVDKIETKIKNIQAYDEVLDYMMTGAVEKKVHIVQNGETFNQIAKDYGLTPSELKASNPEARADRLQIGQELSLTQICPVLTVQTREIATYIARIDYDIAYEETSTLFKGEQTVKSSGIPGEKQVVAEIIRENGAEVSRTEISTETLKEPKTQVVLKGTKDPPPLIGTGTYIYPTRGTLSSRFGTRWGRMHYGIDLAAPTGTKIRAADGGKVIYAGWDGSLGYTVRIDHGGNQVSVYGHCSKILVSKGEKVYQGQHIANVGNTGRSTGPHLHFEIRVNGVAKNPLKYLN